MSLGSILGGIAKGRVRQRGRAAFGLATMAMGYRVFRRITRVSDRPALRFQVKPGEVYEIRGIKRGK
jgi:hypothetical protein